jgi:heptosyltransferase-3
MPTRRRCWKAIRRCRELHLIDRHWKRQGLRRQGAAELRLIAAQRARRYDLVVHLSVHTRGAWLVRLLRPRWAVAPKFRPGFWAKELHPPLSRAIPCRTATPSTPTSTACAQLGIDVPAAEDRRVTLVPGAAAEARVDALLAPHGLARRQKLRPCPSGVALGLQVLAGGARRRAVRCAGGERGCPSC